MVFWSSVSSFCACAVGAAKARSSDRIASRASMILRSPSERCRPGSAMLRPAQRRRKTRALCQNQRNEMDHPARDLEPYDPPGTELVSAIFSSVSRKGEWLPAEVIEVRAWFGNARLDFTSALL